MEHLEVVIFDEVDDYKEKIKGLTFRQWIFSGLALIVVIPTYLLIPKYLGISKDITSYIVMLEAAIIGFFGFIKIHNLDAEQIVPYWYRHYFIYNKPIKYITDKQWEEEHTKDKKKANKAVPNKNDNIKQEPVKQPESKVVNTDTKAKEKQLSKKELKAQQKQQKLLEKAKKKYGSMIDTANDEEIQEITSETTQVVEAEIEQKQEDVVIDTPVEDTDEVSIEKENDMQENLKTIAEETNDEALHMLMGMLTPEQLQQLSKMAQKNDDNTQ